jgi:hypothetical protein|tara:strand:- start:15498 stop:15932 length:435 start_codon:yes stop_codon:yes gene_type:complete
VPEVEFKENDQIIVDNFLEQDYSSFKLLKSNVCIVLVVGKYDLIVKSHDSSYYPKVFPVSKSVCRRISKVKVKSQVEIIIPQINDLVAGITSDLGNKEQEMHVGILEEIRHNNTSSKTAVVREGNKRTSISLSNLVVLEQKNEK